MAKIKWIRKRDNRQLPFDPTKIADAIFQATRAVGQEDRALAEELSEAVTLYLEKDYEGEVPGIEDIQDMVERVLIETGHARTAKAYILYRDRRAHIRETLRVRREMETGVYGVSRQPTVSPGGGERVEGWSKGKIAAALVREAGLDASLSAEVARAVERKVFAAEVQSISTRLIRELVDNELFERGLEGSLFRQAQVGIPKYDLEGILLGGGKDPSSISARIGNRILQDFALEEVYPREVVQAHREGAIHIHSLDAPLSLLEAHIHPAEEPEAGEGALEMLLAADGAVSRSVHLGGYGIPPLGPEIFSPPGAATLLRGDWCRSPAGGLCLHLPPGSLEGVAPERMRTILSRPFGAGLETQVVVGLSTRGSGADGTLAEIAAMIARGHRVSIRWDPPFEESAVVAQEIALNLPRAARTAGAGNFTTFLETAHTLISLAYSGLNEGWRFRDRIRGGAGASPAVPGARERHRISLVGLADAVRGITGGDPALGGKSWELHLEAIDSIRGAVEDLAELGGAPVDLGGTTPQPAATRFARLDLATRQGYSRPSPSPAYANGPHLGLDVPIPLGERIEREKEVAGRAGFGVFVAPRFTEGPPSPDAILDLLLQTRGYPGVVTVARIFHPVPED